MLRKIYLVKKLCAEIADLKRQMLLFVTFTDNILMRYNMLLEKQY